MKGQSCPYMSLSHVVVIKKKKLKVNRNNISLFYVNFVVHVPATSQGNKSPRYDLV